MPKVKLNIFATCVSEIAFAYRISAKRHENLHRPPYNIEAEGLLIVLKPHYYRPSQTPNYRHPKGPEKIRREFIHPNEETRRREARGIAYQRKPEGSCHQSTHAVEFKKKPGVRCPKTQEEGNVSEYSEELLTS